MEEKSGRVFVKIANGGKIHIGYRRKWVTWKENVPIVMVPCRPWGYSLWQENYFKMEEVEIIENFGPKDLKHLCKVCRDMEERRCATEEE